MIFHCDKKIERKYETLTEILLFIVSVTDVTKSDKRFFHKFFLSVSRYDFTFIFVVLQDMKVEENKFHKV